MYVFSILSLAVIFIIEPLMLGSSISIFAFLDLAVLLITAILLCGALLAGGQFKNFGNALKISFSKNEFDFAQLENAKKSVNYFIVSLWASAAFGMIYSMISLFGNLDNVDQFRPNFAVALLFPFYASILFLLALPIKIRIQKLIDETDEGLDSVRARNSKTRFGFIAFSLLSIFLVYFFVFPAFGDFATIAGTIDVPSIAMLFFVTCGALLAGKEFKDFIKALKIAFSKKEFTFGELKKSETAINYFIIVLWATTALNSVFAAIFMLDKWEEKSLLGPIVAVLLITIYDAAVLTLLALPIKEMLRSRVPVSS